MQKLLLLVLFFSIFFSWISMVAGLESVLNKKILVTGTNSKKI